MPIALMLAALCSGLVAAFVWIGLGGTGLIAFFIYVLTGHLVMAAMLAQTALRSLR